MPEIGLNGAGVMPSVGQAVAAGMAQHVRVCRNAQARKLPIAPEQVVDLSPVECFPTLREEDRPPFSTFDALPYLQPGAQGFQFVRRYRVGGGRAVLAPFDERHPCIKIEAVEGEAARLRHPPPAAVHPKNQAAIPYTVTAAL